MINNKKIKKIELLKDYFQKRSDVLMAFVFGSSAKGQETIESDFDIAVYFKPEGREIEWEETKEYPDENQIWTDVEKIVGIRTDFVVLNRAPSNLFSSVLHEGIPIIIKDRALYLRISLMISFSADYFRDFVLDFWAIKQRSSSLSEIDKEKLIKMLDFISRELNDYNKFINLDQGIYEKDSSKRRDVERWAENIVNSSIDIAKIILASGDRKIPQTYREIMQQLCFVENFDKEASEKLAEFAKLRNILAHEYLDIRFIKIKKFIIEAEPFYKKLIEFAKGFIGN